MRRIFFLAALFLVQTIYSGSVDLHLSEGRIFYKAPADTVWSIKDGHITVNPGDTLKSTGTDKVILSAGDGLRFMLSNETYVLFNKEDEIKVELVKGQVLFDRTDETPFVVTAKWCEFKPEGTAAAVKINKKGQASVAVLRGNVNMKAPSGVAQTVPAGAFSSYDASASSFSPVKPLPESARTSLESYSGIKVDAPMAAEAKEEQPSDDNSASSDAAGSTVASAQPEKSENKETEEKVESQDKDTKERAADNEPKNADNKDIASSESDDKKESDGKDAGASTSGSKSTSSDIASNDEDKKDEEAGKGEGDEKTEDSAEDDKEGPGHKPVWEISAGMVTIDDAQWTRIAVAVDVPVWRFGVCFDLEMFLDSEGNFSNRGWNFSDGRSAGQSLLRKIRYIRFNKEEDPVFIKVGGLDNVTYNYGFIVNGFTNMLDYPGTKLFGVQFDINDVSPIGLTMRTMIPDVMDFGNDGGMIFNQLGFRPMKALDKKILSGIKISGIFAADFNQYAPARDWDYTMKGSAYDLDEDGIQDSTNVHDIHFDPTDTTDYYEKVVQKQKNANAFDTIIEHKDKWASRAEDKFMMLGGDIIVPILTGKVIKLDLYGQAGLAFAGDDSTVDKTFKGWGIGAPGAFAKLGPVWAQIEYRHARDQFEAGYFNTYYLKERISRDPIFVKEQNLSKEHKNGVFGKLGFNIKNFLVLEGAYQYMKGDGYKTEYYADGTTGQVENIDQRFNAVANVGDVLLSKIPKVTKVEAFYDQTNINSNIFKSSINTYWGYRVGVEVVKGAGIIWETRYGWKYEDGKLVDDKQIRLAAALRF